MKELLKQYAAYNLWANQRILDVVKTLNEEQVQQEINSSFKSIYKTLVHSWAAETSWWQRVQQLPQDPASLFGFSGPTAELLANISRQSATWKDWVNIADEESLQQELAYQNIAKQHFKQPIYQILLHVFNHATYHRGQLITMFRQVGAAELPSTDFTTYTRSI